MANVPVQNPAIAGTVLTATAATAGPDTVSPGSLLLIQNGSGSAVTATVVVPGNTRYGQAQPDVTTVSIGAGAIAAVGPLGGDLADPTDDLVDVTLSLATSVNLYAIRVANA